MAGNEENHVEGSSSLGIGNSMVGDGGGGGTPESFSHPFQCCVCLDLLYKPIVLACGHISCFWCVHKAMHGWKTSHCPICRQPYRHFPSICQLLHFLLLKIEPVEYKRREKEVLEEENQLELFSPQFLHHRASEGVHPDEIKESSEKLKPNGDLASKEVSLPENGILYKQISADDVLCVVCKELPFHPAVLNCGHVYCESCLSSQVSEPLKCHACHKIHPGEFPNVCLDLHHFLEEQFPREYAMRKERVWLEKMQCMLKNPSSSASGNEKQNAESSCKIKGGYVSLDVDSENTHLGVGCDSCGRYPIVGKRYKCQDCEEKIGFDLCEDCYNTNSKLPGRFNQRHTPDHRFELDDSHAVEHTLYDSLLEYVPYHVVLDGGDPDDHDNSDTASNV